MALGDRSPPARGRRWEARAESFLSRRGLSLRERNFRCRLGEIDLVMEQGSEIVFVEVRYRRSERYGSGADTVGCHKQRRIARAAALYLHRHPECATRVCRFDVVSVHEEDGTPQFRWIRNAFQAGG